MEIDFFINFDKRVNSTKRPVVGGLVEKYTLTGNLKEPCSVMSPVINIQNIPVQNAPCVFTYAWIPRFYRYYFVKDWVWNDGLWTVQLEVDVLATYKPHIGETYAYIERASADAQGNTPYYNGNIIDRMYPAKNDFDTDSILLDAPWTGWDIEDGCYVLGIISRTNISNVGGAVQYYALTHTQIRDLLEYMLNDTFYDNAGFSATNPDSQLTHDLAKAIVNPIQYITSCMWFPCAVSRFTTADPITIKVGPWTTLGTGSPILSRVGYRSDFSVTVPSHPQASTRGAYLNYSPYSRILCMLPPFGAFTIDPSYIPDDRTIVFTIQVDGITGKACLQICREDTTQGKTDFFYESSAMFGVPIQLAQLATDYIGAIKGAVTTIGSAVAGVTASSFTGGAMGAMMTLGSIGNTLSALQPQVTSEGVNGSFIAFERLTGTFPRLTVQFVKVVDEDNTEIGRPLCEVKQIQSLSGYIKCGECTVDFYAFESELNKIHSLMLNGFFWE